MTKFSQIPTNNSPVLADTLIGVTSGGVDDRITLAQLAALVSLNLTTNTVAPSKLNNPYKFNAYANAYIGVSGGVWTKAPINTVNFDSNGNFNTSLNRYVVPVTGYYFISFQVRITQAGASANVALQGALYKNGAGFIYGSSIAANGSNGTVPSIGSGQLVYLVAGDYLESYGYCGEARGIDGGAALTFMTGFMLTPN